MKEIYYFILKILHFNKQNNFGNYLINLSNKILLIHKPILVVTIEELFNKKSLKDLLVLL
jgi:hypothetical protein